MVYKVVLKVINNNIAWHDEAKRKLQAFREKMNGKVIEITMRANPKNKTSDQHNFLWLMISNLGKFLASGDLQVFEDEFKESIGMFKYVDLKNLKTGKVDVHKKYISIAKLKFDEASHWIEAGLDLCDHMEYPMRALYEEFKEKHKHDKKSCA